MSVKIMIEKSNSTNYLWGHSRRFNAYSNYMQKKFGKRIQKVSLDCGMTCPNRDGTIGTGGCHYCNNDGFNPAYCNSNNSIYQQIEDGIFFLSQRYRADEYLAYFQTYSNTYAEISRLEKIYNDALSHPKIRGLVIGTRPDCINEDILDLLEKLAETKEIYIEYGIESCYNKTLQSINRGHDFETSVMTIERTAKRKNINICAHLIFGLPGESREQMLNEAEIISKLPLNSIKLHQLQIIRNTFFEKLFIKDPSYFNIFTLEEYLDFIIDFLERINPKFIVERLFSEAPPRHVISHVWGKLRNDDVIRRVEKRMTERDTWQGKYFRT
ncbi:MAG: TIGR01212 family radical SAM protein [Bacteroidota bacterium]|nr:TIGR01212 family radical SAM protein [Bacteroidota bacterium]